MFINNKNRGIVLPHSIINQDSLGELFMGKCENDTIFKHLKNIRNLGFYSDTFNKNILQMELFELSIGFKKGSIKNLINIENKYLRKLILVSNKSEMLDTTILFFPNLKIIEFRFNPFNNTNFELLKKMDYLEKIFVNRFDFSNTSIKSLILQKTQKYKIYIGPSCLLTDEQKELLKKYDHIILMP